MVGLGIIVMIGVYTFGLDVKFTYGYIVELEEQKSEKHKYDDVAYELIYGHQ